MDRRMDLPWQGMLSGEAQAGDQEPFYGNSFYPYKNLSTPETSLQQTSAQRQEQQKLLQARCCAAECGSEHSSLCQSPSILQSNLITKPHEVPQTRSNQFLQHPQCHCCSRALEELALPSLEGEALKERLEKQHWAMSQASDKYW